MKRNRAGQVVRALTIAGSDSSGGAGIQADIKTFAAFEVYGMSVVTALTAQNTLGVQGVAMQTPAFVVEQLRAVLDDVGADAAKTGMLGTAEIIDAVAKMLSERPIPNLVVDPVMVAKGGASLLQSDAMDAMRQCLLPLADVVTPNIPEAEVLCGYRLDSWDTCRRAARDISKMGPKAVIIKGGHAQEDWASNDVLDGLNAGSFAADLIFANGTETYFVTPRIQSQKTHGTGCTFSAAITACLARTMSLLDAVCTAKTYIYDAIASAVDWEVGHGHGPTNHSAALRDMNFDAPTAPGFVYVWQDGAWVQRTEVHA